MRMMRRATPHTTESITCPTMCPTARLGARTSRACRWGLLTAAAFSAAACVHPRPPLVVTDTDPSIKIPAIEKAVRERDMKASRQLVKDLDSDDPAVRFYAIDGLRRLTKQDFGYRYFDDDDRREPACRKWQQWLDGQERPATRP
jgi:hypothetical protein